MPWWKSLELVKGKCGDDSVSYKQPIMEYWFVSSWDGKQRSSFSQLSHYKLSKLRCNSHVGWSRLSKFLWLTRLLLQAILRFTHQVSLLMSTKLLTFSVGIVYILSWQQTITASDRSNLLIHWYWKICQYHFLNLWKLHQEYTNITPWWSYSSFLTVWWAKDTIT